MCLRDSIGGDGEAGGEVVLDAGEPGELVGGEGRAGLGLLGEPVLEAFVDGEWVGD